MAAKDTIAGVKRKAGYSGKPDSVGSSKKPRLQTSKKPAAKSELESPRGAGAKREKRRPDKISKTEKNGDRNQGKDFERGENSRESHVKQRQLAKERKAAKPLADELQRTKKIWERLRRKSHVPADERKVLVEELFGIITGRMKDFVLKHDAVRAVQTAIKYGTADQRKQIARELQGTYTQLAESRYAKFLIGKLMVQNDAEIRDMIIPEFYGKVRRLINHPEASWILDDIYRQVATKEQKDMLLREWYGPEFSLFEPAKDAAPTADLSQILENDPYKRAPIMKTLLAGANSLIQKKMTGFTMLHDAMLQYFLNLKPDTEEHTEFFEIIKGDESGDLLRNMAFTKSGARLVCLLLARGSSKDRRQILKTYKNTFTMMSGDGFGHMVILTAYDVIDDTKLTSKAIFPELLGETLDKATECVLASTSNPFARTTILYLLEGASKALFPESLSSDLEILEEIHDIRRTTSKKDNELRRRELVAAISPQLLTAIASASSTLIHDSFGCQFILDILLSAEGDKTAALEAVAAAAGGNPKETVAQEDTLLPPQQHISRTAHGGRLLKTLISGGRFDKKSGQVKQVDPPLRFADLVYPLIKEHVMDWATGPSSFVIVSLLEATDFSSADELIQTLKRNKTDLEKAATGGAGEQSAAKGSADSTKITKKKSGAPAGNTGSKILLDKIR